MRDAAVPYKVLLKFRRNKDPARMSKPCFGCNAIVGGTGIVRVGDRVEVLEWWLQSGLQLAYDQEVLWGATRYNRPEVLEWWDKSGLPIQYRMCDIEEALEDAIGGGEKARAWWRQKGIDFNANDKEWMKLQNLH